MSGAVSRFKAAVVSIPAVAEHYRAGLQALRAADDAHVVCDTPRKLTGSIDLDSAKHATEPQAARWDYGIGFKPSPTEERAIWVEVHPASSSGNIAEIEAKLAWLLHWLSQEGNALNYAPREFIWVASGRCAFPGNSPDLRRLSAKGLKFSGRRLLLA